MAPKFEIVSRPRGTSNVPTELVNALIATERDGTAVRLKLEGRDSFTTWQANVRAKLRTEANLRLRTKFNKVTNEVTAWSEKFAEDRLPQTAEELGVDDDSDVDEAEATH
jgi:hypothetical protein